MMRIVDMSRTGLYVVLRNGAIATVGGRNFWDNLKDLRETLRAHNLSADEHVIRTAP